MKCSNCGNLLAEGDLFCKNCGTAVNNNPVQNEGQVNQINQPIGNQSVPNDSAYQNNPNNAQSWMQGYNAQPNMQNRGSSNGNGKFILVAIAIIVFVFAAVITFTQMLKEKESSSGENETTETTETTENSGTTVTQVSTYTVNIGGFSFKIPTSYVYEIDDGDVYIYDEESEWAAYLQITSGSYSTLKSNASQLQGLYQSSGYNASEAKVSTYGGVEYLTIEIGVSGSNYLFAYAKLNAMYVLCITLYNAYNDFNYDALEGLSSIVSSATYVGESTNIETNVDMLLDQIQTLGE